MHMSIYSILSLYQKLHKAELKIVHLDYKIKSYCAEKA